MQIGINDVLIIIDVQNDFCPGGALVVPKGDEVISLINNISGKFRHVIATQDWHPKNHISFKKHGGKWPPHCIKETRGADFHPELHRISFTHILRKGTLPDNEAYSAFSETGLKSLLKELNTRHVFIVGLATDYCVLQTALDSRMAQFSTFVLTDAIRAVEAKPGNKDQSLKQMSKAGVKLYTSTDLT